MASDNPSTCDTEDLAARQVFFYYKKFSQNKDLPKYFSGTSLSYLPEFKEDVDDTFDRASDLIIKSDVEIVSNYDTEKKCEAEDNSRASSAMSGRKLEWDNLADIGYDNCAKGVVLKKSLSLTALSDLKQKRVNFDLPELIAKIKPSTTSRSTSSSDRNNENVKLILFTCSSSSDSEDPELNVDISSSSSSIEEKKCTLSNSSSSSSKNCVKNVSISNSGSSSKENVTNFAHTLSYLKKKIGLPEAHSTPNTADEIRSDSGVTPNTSKLKKLRKLTKTVKSKDTPTSSKETSHCNIKESKEEKIKIVEKDPNEVSGKLMRKKVVNLCTTKPIFLECVCSPEKPASRKIQVQSKQNDVAVQTDNISEKEIIKIITKTRERLNQSLLLMEHPESDKKGSSRACSSQTGSDVFLSNCESFEYFKNNEENKIPDIEWKDIDDVQKLRSSMNRSQKRDNVSGFISDQSQSPYDAVEEIIATNNVDKVGDDIENKIYVLQRLLKSRKFDSSTKKRYVKQILEQISESKYLGESSTSSDLFKPKKSKLSTQKIVQNLNATSSSTSSSQKGILKKSSPRYYTEERVRNSPRKKELEIKTFVDEILPKAVPKGESSSATEIFPVDAREDRRKLLSVTHVDRNSKNKLEFVTHPKPSYDMDNTSLEKQCDSSLSAKSVSYQNWKEDKTVSEKKHEELCVNNVEGDYLSLVASREREFQLNWISDEIDHLGKLKILLEKNPKKPPTVGSDRSNKTQKTTSVYVVSEDSDETGKREKRPQKKYVIETQISGGSNAGGKRRFQLNGKKYTVKNMAEKKLTTGRPFVGDIEVASSDTTMNIKITTFCESCKRSPCVCVQEFLEGVRNPFVGELDLAKENDCQVCKQSSCCCLSTRSRLTVCSLCRKVPCICNKGISKSSTLLERCCSCHSCPCRCRKGYRKSSGDDSYEGQFIAANGSPDLITKMSIVCESNSCSCGSHSNGEVCIKGRKEDVSSKNSRSAENSSQGSSGDNSLNRVFENCNCKVQKECDCGFVNKLYKHFNLLKIPEYVLQKGDAPDKKSKNIVAQIHNLQFDKISQTDKSNLYPHESVGVQAQAEVVNVNQQTSGDFTSPKKVVYVDEATTTETVLLTEASVQAETPLGGNKGTQITSERAHPKFVDTKGRTVQKARSRSAESYRERDVPIEPRHKHVVYDIKEVKEVKTVMATAVKEQQTSSQGVKDTQTVTIVQQEKHAQKGIKRSVVAQTDLAQLTSVTVNSDPPVLSQKHISEDHTKLKNGIVHASVQTLEVEKPIKETIERREMSCQYESKSGSSSRIRSSVAEPSTSYSVSYSRSDSEICVCGFKKRTRRSVLTEDYKNNGRSRGKGVSSAPSSVLRSANEISSSTAESTPEPTTSCFVPCMCCKCPNSQNKMTVLRCDEQDYPFCQQCVSKKPILTTICYSGPDFVCRCFESDISRPASALQSGQTDEYCTCTKPSRLRHSQYCRHCQNKLRRTLKSRNGIAYTLTLENETPSKVRTKKKRKNALEEIKIRVPSSHSRKKYKDKENSSRKQLSGTLRMRKVSENADKEVPTIQNRQLSEKDEPTDDKVKGEVVNKTKMHADHKEVKRRSNLTLQEYLKLNRPDFIDSAEYRRMLMLKSRFGREVMKDDDKLKFLEENMGKDKPKKETKLFSEKEMREITKKNYHKLPEVQKKLANFREQRLKSADKLMVAVFTKKLQGSILKGKSRFPIDSKVVNI